LTKATWYFDFISPFAYFHIRQFSKLPKDLVVSVVPVAFGGLLKHWGQLGPAEIPPKRRFIYRFFKWQADQMGIPFVMPNHPFNPLPSLRLCVAADCSVEQVGAIFDLIYGKGVQPDEADGIAAIAKILNISDPEAVLSDPLVKEKLRQNTLRAVEDEVFGVPTFVLNDQVFWGADATDMMLDFLNNSQLFETPEMQSISEMPMGVVRKKKPD